MRISEASALTGLSISNIRFYEKKGLLEPEREKENKYRDYTPTDILRLKQIVLYRKMDLPVEQIAALFDGTAVMEDLLNEQIACLKEKQKMLEGSINLCEEVLLHPLVEDSDIEYYLNYVKSEEQKGSLFANIEEALTDYATTSQYERFAGYFFMWKPFGKYRLDRIARILWSLFVLAIPIILLIEMYMDKSDPTIAGTALFLFITLVIWSPLFSRLHKK